MNKLTQFKASKIQIPESIKIQDIQCSFFSQNEERFFECNSDKDTHYEFTFIAEENSQTQVCIFNQTTEEIIHSISIHTQIKKNAYLELIVISKDFGKSLIKIENNLEAEHSRIELKNLVFGKKNAQIDIQCKNNGKASQSIGNIVSRVILEDESKCFIQAAPIVEVNAKNCISHLEQKTLLMDKKTKIQTIPMLFISNNEVEASHSATISTFAEEDLFYLQSRGLTEKESQQLLKDAFVQDIVHSLSEEMREKIEM